MKTKRYVPFNLNDCVRVRLTDHGRKILRERFRKLNASIPLTADLKYEPKKEDADGSGSRSRKRTAAGSTTSRS